MFQRFRNRFSSLGAISTLAGVGMAFLGDYLPNTGWSWVTPLLSQIVSIIGFILIGIALVLFIRGFFGTSVDDAYPSLRSMFGIRKKVWDIYKLEQSAAIRNGEAGLNIGQIEKLKTQARRDWNMRVKTVIQPLSESESDEIVERFNNKYKSRHGVSKKQLNKMVELTSSVDKCGLGINTLLKDNKRYTSLNNSLSVSRLSTNNGKTIGKIRRYAYVINSLLLVMLYLRGEGTKIAPEFALPWDSFPEIFDEEMRTRIETLR